jgi:hypothetical protein
MNKSILRNIVGNMIFSVMFQKADGTLRTMVCRVGVRKYLHGGTSTHKGTNNLTVYDMHKRGYRVVPCDRLISYKVKGTVYTV